MTKKMENDWHCCEWENKYDWHCGEWENKYESKKEAFENWKSFSETGWKLTR